MWLLFLWRMLNQPEPSGTALTFPDCNSSAYYYKAVRWACSSDVGIASGYENGNFGPTDLVSNQDLLTFLYRFACHCGYITNSSTAQANYRAAFEQSVLSYPNTFWDYSKVAVGWAYETGFITNFLIKGTTTATRGETAKYIYHFYQRYQKNRISLEELYDYSRFEVLDNNPSQHVLCYPVLDDYIIFERTY